LRISDECIDIIKQRSRAMTSYRAPAMLMNKGDSHPNHVPYKRNTHMQPADQTTDWYHSRS